MFQKLTSKPSEALPLLAEPSTGSPGRARGHAHRRSTAISGHDLASILQPRDSNAAPRIQIPMVKENTNTNTLPPSPVPPLEDVAAEDSTVVEDVPVSDPLLKTDSSQSDAPVSSNGSLSKSTLALQ